MLEVGAIGAGNAGGQVIKLVSERLKIDTIAINSSDNDLATLPDTITKILIGKSKGSGKDRNKAKQFLKSKVMDLLKMDEFISFMNKDVVFVVSSCGGGTGSGIAPILAELLRQTFPDVTIILIGILPTLNEAAFTQLNAAEYLDELYNSSSDATYMLYDNHTMNGLPDYQLLPSINEAIVRDIEVIRGTYQTSTPFASIDENDMTDIISVKGRLVVGGIYDIKEKVLEDNSVDDLLVDAIKNSAHAELQRDKIVKSMGVITNLTQKIYDKYKNELPHVEELIGKPDIDFSHVVVNNDNAMPNNAIVVMSGLSPIIDRLNPIKEEVNSYLEEKEKKDISQGEIISSLSDINIGKAKEARHADKIEAPAVDSLDVDDIFSKFNI